MMTQVALLTIEPMPSVVETLDLICDAVERRRIAGHDLLEALDLGDAICHELRERGVLKDGHNADRN